MGRSRNPRGATRQAAPAGFLGCLLVGWLVAIGWGIVALALIVLAALTGAVIMERRRMAPVLWAGVALTAPLQSLRVVSSLAVSDVLLVAALITILPDALRSWRRGVVPTGLVTAFGLIVSAGLVGTFFAPDVAVSLVNLFKMALAVVGSVVAMALWDPGTAALRRFAWLWLLGASASAVWAALHPRVYVGRALGLTNHPNHFGLVCMLGVGLGLGLALSSTGRARLAALAGAAILTLGVGLSGSRSALLGLIVTVGLTALLTRKFRLLVATGVVVVLGAMAVIVGIVHVPDSTALGRLGGGGGSGVSDAARRDALTDAFDSISRRPLTGEGFEFAQVAHNIYVQALVVGGPMALLGFLWASGLIVRRGLRASSVGRGSSTASLLGGLTAAYVGYLCSGLFSPILWDRYLWTYIGLLLVLAATVLRQNANGRPESSALQLSA